MVTRQKIADDLRALGLQQAEKIVVHSSLRSLGRVEGEAEAVVGAFLDVIGPEGLLMLPTFTYRTPRFIPASTPCATGRIPEVARSWCGAIRSLHPTYSVAAIGKEAADICSGHERVGSVSLGSPLDKLAGRGGSVVLLGVGHTSNTTIHLGEAHAKSPYLDIPFWPDLFPSATVVTPDGEIEVPLREHSGCSKAFGVVEGILRQRGQIRDGMVGGALAQRVSCRAVIDATVFILKSNPAGVLCTDPRCYRCSQAHLRIRKLQ